MKTVILALIILLAPQQSPTIPTVFGLKLGHRIELPECLKLNGEYEEILVKSTCLKHHRGGGSSIVFPFRDKPDIMKSTTLAAIVIDGNLEGVMFHTFGLRTQTTDLERLKEKYGEPSSVNKRVAQNRIGGKFETFDAVWVLPDLHVSFAPVVSTLDEGFIVIDTQKGREARRKLNAAGVKDRQPL